MYFLNWRIYRYYFLRYHKLFKIEIIITTMIKRIKQPEPRVEHVCEVSPKEDPLMRTIPGSSAWSRLRRWFLGTRITSRRHPFTLWCLKSTRAIDYEISRHLKSHSYMIHPFSTFRSVTSFRFSQEIESRESSIESLN